MGLNSILHTLGNPSTIELHSQLDAFEESSFPILHFDSLPKYHPIFILLLCRHDCPACLNWGSSAKGVVIHSIEWFDSTKSNQRVKYRLWLKPDVIWETVSIYFKPLLLSIGSIPHCHMKARTVWPSSGESRGKSEAFCLALPKSCLSSLPDYSSNFQKKNCVFFTHFIISWYIKGLRELDECLPAWMNVNSKLSFKENPPWDPKAIKFRSVCRFSQNPSILQCLQAPQVLKLPK